LRAWGNWSENSDQALSPTLEDKEVKEYFQAKKKLISNDIFYD
jgi:hypothetical protein